VFACFSLSLSLTLSLSPPSSSLSRAHTLCLLRMHTCYEC
jgi:hypothetical protein